MCNILIFLHTIFYKHIYIFINSEIGIHFCQPKSNGVSMLLLWGHTAVSRTDLGGVFKFPSSEKKARNPCRRWCKHVPNLACKLFVLCGQTVGKKKETFNMESYGTWFHDSWFKRNLSSCIYFSCIFQIPRCSLFHWTFLQELVRQNCIATEDLGMTISSMSDLQERWATFFGSLIIYIYIFKSIHLPLRRIGVIPL